MPRDEILIKLKNIEKKLDKSERRADMQGLWNLGYVLMFGSLALLAVKAPVWGILVTFFLGVVLALGAPYIVNISKK